MNPKGGIDGDYYRILIISLFVILNKEKQLKKE